MPLEIERKFLVIDNSWRKESEGELYRQGYLSSVKDRVVRVRVAGSRAFLTIKGPSNGAARLEFEYEIPVEEADEMLDKLCLRPFIEKYRYKVGYGGLVWEIDEFIGENTGLVLAEIELTDPAQEIEIPEWIGREVTGEAKYYNVNLVTRPYLQWGKDN